MEGCNNEDLYMFTIVSLVYIKQPSLRKIRLLKFVEFVQTKLS